jgi:5-methylcytosine-specific restriction endonuclease McrA
VATLLLNASIEPLAVISPHRAVNLVLQGRAVVEVASGELLHGVSVTVAVPSVARLVRYVHVPYHRRQGPPSRQAVLVRDGHRCGYCGRQASTIDHVIPRSRGGSHTYDNVVAACLRCNNKKSNRLLAEMGWSLRHRPVAPAATWRWQLLGAGRGWDNYLSAVA